MPRVAYITCDTPPWYEIASSMAREEGWQPVYWIADAHATAEIEERFPGVIVHTRKQAYHMVSPPQLADLALEPLDAPFLDAMSEAQVVALKMMDIVDSGDAFGFNERRRFFRQRLQYWRAVLKAVRPDVAVFGFSAHVVYDFAIYVLCRHAGIRTVMFESVFDFALLFPMEDPMVGSLEIKEAYERLVAADAGGPLELPPLYEKYLERVQGKYADALPWYMKQQFESFPKDMAREIYRGKGDK
jgi:hypothetical protein